MSEEHPSLPGREGRGLLWQPPPPPEADLTPKSGVLPRKAGPRGAVVLGEAAQHGPRSSLLSRLSPSTPLRPKAGRPRPAAPRAHSPAAAGCVLVLRLWLPH